MLISCRVSRARPSMPTPALRRVVHRSRLSVLGAAPSPLVGHGSIGSTRCGRSCATEGQAQRAHTAAPQQSPPILTLRTRHVASTCSAEARTWARCSTTRTQHRVCAFHSAGKPTTLGSADADCVRLTTEWLGELGSIVGALSDEQSSSAESSTTRRRHRSAMRSSCVPFEAARSSKVAPRATRRERLTAWRAVC